MENISVSVRVRPLNRQEQGEGFSWRIDGNSMCQVDPATREPERGRDAKYALDHVFGPETSTAQLYAATTQGLIRKLVNGFNSTVFAYGQTSSGKTHTMRGAANEPGIIPMAVHEVFSIIEQQQDREFLLRVSYMELYNEDINDLLAPENLKLPVHESKEAGVYVAGLREDIVVSPEQVLSLIAEGEANRHIGATKMNEGSSRSHTVFRMVIESRARDGAVVTPSSAEQADGSPADAGAILVSTLTLVDLAGSERVAKTGAEGIRMKEGTAINKSLLTLGNVINKLSEGAAAAGGHIPYRDSKLTRILQPSLGGNAKTAIICNITPAACHVEESHSTLRFACRAKRVVNNAVVNEVLSDAAVLKRQANEIAELRRALAETGNADVEQQIGHLRAQLLRSEQDNELMRIKLEQETAEREKAQKQVEMAKRIMFGQQAAQSEEPLPRRNSRRETWCPGRSAWGPPVSGGATGRKRSLHTLGTAEEEGSSRAGLMSALQEGEEEDEDGEEEGAPCAQRARLSDAGEVLSHGSPMDGGQAEQGGLIGGELLDALHSRLRELKAELQVRQQQLATTEAQLLEKDEQLRSATEQVEELTSARTELAASVEQLSADKERLVPQLEQARWQARQQEKRAEEASAARALAEQAATEAQEALQNAGADADVRNVALASQLETTTTENVQLREQLKDAAAAVLDLKGQLEVQGTALAMLEAREKTHGAQLAEQAARGKDKAAELERIAKELQAALERADESEERSRELQECNQRLEAHVHDLESRKRAPLYQKRQEEELRAALEKATEADARAHEAEMRAKEAKEALEETSKTADELREQILAAQQSATADASKVAEAHALELQRLQVERTKLEATHEDAMTELRAELQKAQDVLGEVQTALSAAGDTSAAQAVQLEEAQAATAELQGQLAESQACANAARERIEVLEAEAEAAAEEHQQETAAAAAALESANAAGACALKEAQDAAAAAAQAVAAAHEEQLQGVRAELDAAREAAASEAAELRASLDSTNELLAKAMEAGRDAEARAAEAAAEATRELEAARARLAEAAGVLNAKDELREARVKHKQEIVALKQELAKLQVESKSGQRGKDVAAKDLEAARKKVGELEAKVKAAVADKATALQDKANLERQLKQLNSRSTLLEKNLEKKDAQAEKRRESIMVGLNKTRDQLSVSEERLRQLQLDLQRTQMDLLAKSGECSELEKQLSEVQASETALNNAKANLENKLEQVEELLANTVAARDELSGNVAALTEQLAEAQTSAASLDADLQELRAEHAKACAERSSLSEQLSTLSAAHKELGAAREAADSELCMLKPAHAELCKTHDAAVQELASTKEALHKSQEARVHAEGRLPEIDVLQRQISAAHEELSDLRYKLDEQRSAAAAKEASLQGERQALQGQLEAAAHAHERLQLEASAAATRAGQHEKQLQELYELCTTQQGKLQVLMEERQALELRADNLGSELTKSKSAVAEMETMIQAHHAAEDELKAAAAAAQEAAASATECASAREAELKALQASNTAEVAAWQAKAEELKADHAAAAKELQAQLDTAYGELSELQFSSDQDKVALEAAVAAAETRAREAETAAAAAAAAAEAQMQDTSAAEAATARLQEVQAERDQALAAAEALQAELEAAKARAAEMEAIAADVERLRSECTAVEAARAEADAALSAMSAEADVLRGALAAGQEELAALRAVAAPLPSADTPARSRDHLKWEISSMGDELRAEERRRKLAEQRLASSDAALAEARSELEALREAGAHGQPPASYADAVSRGAGSATEAMEALAQREQDIVQLQNSLSHSDEQVRKLTAQIDELRATQSVETQAVKRQFEADCADLRAEAAEQLRTVSEDAARLQRALDSAATENEQLQQQLTAVRAAADTAEQLRQQLATQVSAVSQLQAAKRELESQLAGVEAGDKGAAAEADAMAARRALALAEQCAAEQTAQHEAIVQRLQGQLAALQDKALEEADAVAAREARQARQLEALRAELANVRGSGHSTDALAALHDEALQEVKQIADAKAAELNAKVLQLESAIHWLQQDNERLQAAAADAAAQPAAAAAVPQQPAVAAPAADVAARLSLLESELHKSKRAERKLQALLFRLRADVAALPGDPGLLEKLQDVRSLEYEVDFLTNKCKKYERLLRGSGGPEASAGGTRLNAAAAAPATGGKISAPPALAAGKENAAQQLAPRDANVR